jgi:tetratricopeptide (TPR) repeat protein
MFPADGMDHILTTDQINTIRDAAKPSIAIPMHYRLKGYLGLPQSLGPIEPWLEKQSDVIRLDSNVSALSKLPDSPQIVVFEPSPDLRKWSVDMAEGWKKLDEARQLTEDNPDARPQAAELVHSAYTSAHSIVFSYHWARVLSEAGRVDEAIEVLESSLANSGRQDWEYRMRSRSLLAELYTKAGRQEKAAEQYRIVLDHGYRPELLEKARKFLGHTLGPVSIR